MSATLLASFPISSSMGPAGSRCEPDGGVAWDQIWTTFCDLALAGGPPHRGAHLEPVPKAEVAAETVRYGDVVAEICRGIRMTTGLPAAKGDEPGWVGVGCGCPEEAAWLRFAVTGENVSARRRQAVLRPPAGPSFRAEKEVKNVVVALAKGCHDRDGHLTAAQQEPAGEAVWEAATPTEAATAPSRYEAAVREMVDGLQPAGLPMGPRRHIGGVGVDGERRRSWLAAQGRPGRAGDCPTGREHSVSPRRHDPGCGTGGPSPLGLRSGPGTLGRILAAPFWFWVARPDRS